MVWFSLPMRALSFIKFSSSDINECEMAIDSCDENAECNNTVGSYLCTCTTGYSGDGFSCIGKFNSSS